MKSQITFLLITSYLLIFFVEITNNIFTYFLLHRDRFVFFMCLVLNEIMGKKPSLSQVQRAEIVTLRKEGYSERKISAKWDVSKTAVHRATINWRLRRNYSDLKRSERSKKANVRDNCLIKRMVVQTSTCSIKKVQSALSTKGVKESDMTVSRRLRFDFSLKSQKPAKKPLLTKK